MKTKIQDKEGKTRCLSQGISEEISQGAGLSNTYHFSLSGQETSFDPEGSPGLKPESCASKEHVPCEFFKN